MAGEKNLPESACTHPGNERATDAACKATDSGWWVTDSDWRVTMAAHFFGCHGHCVFGAKGFHCFAVSLPPHCAVFNCNASKACLI
jgi:hypothetical protein